MYNPKKYKKCPLCGKFVKKDGRCKDVFYDDVSGMWEHL